MAASQKVARPATDTAGAEAFSTAAVARLVKVTPARVRMLARAGLCQPSKVRRRYRFSFQDIVLLRTALGLLERRVPVRRVRRALRRLQQQLPAGRPLTGVRISAAGSDVVVRDGTTTWRPDSGQVAFSFLVDDLARAARVLAKVPSPPTARGKASAQDAEACFERGLLLEQEGNLEGARAAYRAAIDADPTLGDAYVNLGRLLHESGDAESASQLYHQAIECDHDDPVAHYNLALALEDQRRLPAALTHYRRAIEISSDFADAHFNLGRLLDRLGRHNEAVRHLIAYKKLMRDS